ncbi:uncharacterized protein LOC136070884 [Quercus suber]|uniref:uncharacterized protein LOC136070884 n=1 Tax=Quercus suber TaxID=58331 RepID=UPI0032DFD656
MSNAKLDEVLSAQKPSSDKTGLGYTVFSNPSSSMTSGSRTIFVPQSEKDNKGEYKAKFDGEMFSENDKVGVGVVIRDSMGQIIAAMAKKIKKPFSVKCLEMVAARQAMLFASKIGLQQCHFEGDSKIGIKAPQQGNMFSSSFGHLVRHTLIHVTSLKSFSFSHIVRQGNTIAHALT